MPQEPAGWSPAERRTPRATRVPHGVLAMLFFIVMEIMLFAGLISAYVISSAVYGNAWPPKGEPPLPVLSTGINTGILLISGFLLWRSGATYAERPKLSQRLLLAATAFGAAFLLFQGGEWLNLLKQGMTLASTTHASYVYLLIGTHALHVCCALAALLWANFKLRREMLSGAAFWTVRLFWYFVVCVWPFLYYLVYLKP